jgi:hypothetical protein
VNLRDPGAGFELADVQRIVPAEPFLAITAARR